jgi:hypothetical protein
MQISNPRRFGLTLAVLVVIIVGVVVIVIKPFSSSKPMAPQLANPSGPSHSTPPSPVSPPAAVAALLKATNNAPFVVVNGNGLRREFVNGVGTAATDAGKLQILQNGRVTWVLDGSCYTKLEAAAPVTTPVQNDFFTPFTSTHYRITHNGVSTEVRWRVPQPKGATIKTPSGMFNANRQGRITSAILTNAGQAEHYTVSYPTSLHLPAPPTRLCKALSPMSATPPTKTSTG